MTPKEINEYCGKAVQSVLIGAGATPTVRLSALRLDYDALYDQWRRGGSTIMTIRCLVGSMFDVTIDRFLRFTVFPQVKEFLLDGTV